MSEAIQDSKLGYTFIVSDKTAFIKLDTLYPECFFYIKDEPQLFPLICLVGDCHRSQNCMEKLVYRLKYIFDTFPTLDLIVLYFKYRDSKSIRMGEFWKDFREPKYSIMNPSAFNKFKEIGVVYSFPMPDSLFIGNTYTPNPKSLKVIK